MQEKPVFRSAIRETIALYKFGRAANLGVVHKRLTISLDSIFIHIKHGIFIDKIGIILRFKFDAVTARLRLQAIMTFNLNHLVKRRAFRQFD